MLGIFFEAYSYAARGGQAWQGERERGRGRDGEMESGIIFMTVQLSEDGYKRKGQWKRGKTLKGRRI